MASVLDTSPYHLSSSGQKSELHDLENRVKRRKSEEKLFLFT